MFGVRKKRVSKKNKQSWRKHVNIKDVEDFLEEKRADERIGEQLEVFPDGNLFQIDTKPSSKKEQHIASSKAEKRKKLDETAPRCFKILEPLTKVPDPITKRNRVRTKEERKDRIVKNIEESNRRRGIVKARVKQSQQDKAYTKAKKEANAYKKGDIKNDIWETEDTKTISSLNNEWYDSDTIRHNHQGLGKLRKHTPKSVNKKTSILPTVEVPHPGNSYNPSFKDHQKLLQDITETETKIIKEEKHLERVTTRMFKKVTPETKEENWLTEMSEGLDKKGNESDNDNEYKSINPPVQNKKKDIKQRRKQKEQRNLENARLKAKQEKKKIADIYKLKFLEKQIEHDKKKAEVLQGKRKKLEKLKLLGPKRLGFKKFEEPDLEFNMPQDLAGNLRNIKPEGNLLKDRFKSLQKRNILEPTVKVQKKRGKVKKFIKASHKD